MSKKSKNTTVRGRKTKKVEEEPIIDNSDEKKEELIDNKKKTRKPVKNTRNKKLENNDEEDELSELELDDENPPIETGDNDNVITTQKTEKTIKQIDPKIPIGNLKTDEIISYLIQSGKKTLNPILTDGALRLLRQLTGKQRNFGFNRSKSNRYYPNQNRGRFPNRNSNNNYRNPRNTRSVNHDNLYEDGDK